jgi:hypothetical protein
MRNITVLKYESCFSVGLQKGKDCKKEKSIAKMKTGLQKGKGSQQSQPSEINDEKQQRRLRI